MNLIVRLVFISFVLCNVACSSEKENEPYFFSDGIDFRVSVSPQSRVTMQEDGSGGFQAGDEIAMWGYEAQSDRIQNKTVLRCEGKRWSSSLYWKDWAGTPHFYAVWPATTQVELWKDICWYVHGVSRN